MSDLLISQLTHFTIKMKEEELLYLIALKKTPLIGDITAKKLITHFGSAKNIFSQKKSTFENIDGIGEKISRNLLKSEYLHEAETELNLAQKNNIKICCFTDDDYPDLLKQCVDGPIFFYQRGNIDLKNKRILSIVGTRNITPYGKAFCEKLIEDLAPLDVVIVSGFAYGVDITAHKAAIDQNLQTIACLAHGLNMVYPQVHSKYCEAIEEYGGFITDFGFQCKFDRKNFLSRNRIIAGLSEATIVIESGAKGGSLVTADIAFSYNREVFAVPGRATDTYSVGCNDLIRVEKARILTSAKDLLYHLNWDKPTSKPIQQQLFIELSAEEEKIHNYLKNNGKQQLDIIAFECQIPVYQTSNLLFQLEMKNVIRPLPGKMFEVI
ncbi:DNA processing protein DprA [Capnocytophaga cynodegmi]|uniref:DNA-processing protein DprA n=1 Tax=Capnocytophaga cynodegmi TaxID=28189 RepID=UPI001EE16B61|nr:DNA-processing protein DprA [Capnocytophaga cynodegmi]GJQ06669.1 DNA processing protein DprA [Capnocytophaga cynodegmi]